MTKTLVASPDDLIDAFKNMTLAELTEFHRRFQDTFGVTDEVVGVVVGDDIVIEKDEEPTAFIVTLVSAGEKRINVIKVVRELLKLGLKEAKDFVDAVPRPVLENVHAEIAEPVAEALRSAGAHVTVDPTTR